MKEINNLTTKNIKYFTSEDTLYIPNKELQNKDFFLCSFVSYDEKSKTVVGKAIKATVNESLYKRQVDDGLILSSTLIII